MDQPVEWRHQRPLGQALAALLVAAAVVLLVRTAALATRLVVLDDPASADFRSRAGDADAFVTATTIGLALVALATIPCFIVWNWRAAKNQDDLGRRPLRFAAGWAVGGWFIPLANLVIPVLVIQDLWRGSDARIARGEARWRIADRSWLVGWWWGLFIVMLQTIPSASADQRPLDVEAVRAQNLLGLLGTLCGATAAILAILVVWQLNARQEECRAAQVVGVSAGASR